MEEPTELLWGHGIVTITVIVTSEGHGLAAVALEESAELLWGLRDCHCHLMGTLGIVTSQDLGTVISWGH